MMEPRQNGNEETPAPGTPQPAPPARTPGGDVYGTPGLRSTPGNIDHASYATPGGITSPPGRADTNRTYGATEPTNRSPEAFALRDDVQVAGFSPSAGVREQLSQQQQQYPYPAAVVPQQPFSGFGGSKRWIKEPNKLIPILFIFTLILFLGTTYVTLHLLPRLQIAERDVEPEKKAEGVILSVTFVFFTGMMLVNYFLSVFTDPGGIPDTRMWAHVLENDGREVAKLCREKKKDGDLRHCKWCAKYKPDRTHHCRVLGRCVLKMDHHCPWIWNTVGFNNHKYFFLLLFNSVVVLWLIAFTFYQTVTDLYVRWSSDLMTTIEFCEKHNRRGRSTTGGGGTGDSLPFSDEFENENYGAGGSLTGSKFDLGLYGNICAALGQNPLLWLLPVGRAGGLGGDPGNGLSYVD